MKKIIFFTLLFLSLFESASCAKPKLMSKKIIEPLAELAFNSKIKIYASTKELYFFTTWKEQGTLTIAKGETSYYLMIKYVALPNKESLSGTIHLLLDNGEKLNLNICGNNLDLKAGATDIVYVNPDNKSKIGTISIPGNSIIYCLYEINRIDLEKISENEITSIVIDHSFGQMLYDTQIGKRKYHKIATKNILEI